MFGANKETYIPETNVICTVCQATCWNKQYSLLLQYYRLHIDSLRLCRVGRPKKINGKLNTCENFHQTRGLSYLSSASSWPPSWKVISQAQAETCSQISFSRSQFLEKRRETQMKMAEIPQKNVNILSRFTKLPDKNQATVLVSPEIILW